MYGNNYMPMEYEDMCGSGGQYYIRRDPEYIRQQQDLKLAQELMIKAQCQHCRTQKTTKLTSKEASNKLTSLMERQLGWKVSQDATAFRLFVKAYWSQISILAHAIHDEE